MDGTLPKISFLKLQGRGAPITPQGWMGVDGMDLHKHYKHLKEEILSITAGSALMYISAIKGVMPNPFASVILSLTVVVGESLSFSNLQTKCKGGCDRI